MELMVKSIGASEIHHLYYWFNSMIDSNIFHNVPIVVPSILFIEANSSVTSNLALAS